ncbi:two component, sigma54 specific, transcriptional regulator, Fis family [Carboxydocella sporoproducens DSM 16521]|uniref:Stage 0 sporulation protein A homolog n=2 Tax=Carboxydocella TaxID=178898 RepID=A0A1T4M7U9_9FIRM|nr:MULTISPECIES: sigma-54 dependent transcriptional regulator [Carboxydocella]AVX21003.1 two-component system, NtrC family, response regulator [Carboxydocella thermautotrophica]AVX31421.1 two-component system, NtrC family, response regulator [Carboxydocella thermautotrophica]SJZ63083.1 two component, sigma54 specific, transcriptional regulator, Fis family [Carboxydocella sporoproducens DSM 16521]
MREQIKVLIVDDEENFRDLLIQRLSRKGYWVKGAATGEEALHFLKEETFQVAIFDIKLPGMDGIELLQQARQIEENLQVIILTGHGTIESAIEAMKMGAYDYLTKPCNLAELEITLQKAYEKKQLLEENLGMKEVLRRDRSSKVIVGKSQAITRVLELAKKVAASDSPVLIEGESGTGKELIVNAIHHWSSRAQQPLVAVNSGALPAQLLESELFGHEKGAFTGALTTKKGLIESAHRGTLFLDEIGEMELGLQVKLLRFLETGEFRRVGDVRLRKVDVRVIAATNRNLEEEVVKGNFREDLYYRLNVIKIRVPPLRERKEDIPLLAEYFLQKAGNGAPKQLASDALEALMSYDYPGNVRELFNILERGILLSTGAKIQKEDLFGCFAREDEPKLCTLEEMEKRYIKQVLEAVQWNKTKAAELLGISVRNLYRKIEEYQLKK